MNVYKISDDIRIQPEYVVAPGLKEAIDLYCSASEGRIEAKNIVSIERIAEDVVI